MTFTPKPTIDFDELFLPAFATFERDHTKGDIIRLALGWLQTHCHAASYNRGWWHDPITGLSLIPGDDTNANNLEVPVAGRDLANTIRTAWFPYVIATKIALCHSETSEGLEAYRVDATDDKIPFPGIVAEGADTLIRWFDLIGCLAEYHHWQIMQNIEPGKRFPYDPNMGPVDYSLGEAIMAKLPFNVGRPDHDLEKRKLPGDKKF